jgi:hypothetical protein
MDGMVVVARQADKIVLVLLLVLVLFLEALRKPEKENE